MRPVLSLSLAAVGALGLVAFTRPSVLGPAAPSLAPAAAPTTYEVDPVHSNVLFKVLHNQAAWFYGRFGAISGTFQHSDDPAQCSLEVEVRTDTVDTRNEKLDQHLRSPDFFDAKQFPTVRFESTKVEEASEGLYRVTGDLSLHGVTKSVTIEVEHVGGSESERGEVIGFHSTFVVDRTEYGMTYGAGGPLGSEVELIVSIEAGAR